MKYYIIEYKGKKGICRIKDTIVVLALNDEDTSFLISNLKYVRILAIIASNNQ